MEHWSRRAHREHVVRNALRAEILRSPAAGTPLENEAVLGRRFGVSRNVVRSAVMMLAAEGLIERRRGWGTRTRDPLVPIGTGEGSLVNVNIVGPERPFHAHERVLRWSAESASVGVAAALEMSPGAPVIMFEHLTGSAGPLIFWTTFLRLDAGLDQPAPVGSDVPTGFLGWLAKSGNALGRCIARTSALGADSATAEVLNVPLGFPIMRMDVVLKRRDASVFGSTTGYLRTDRVTWEFAVDH